MNQWLKLSCTSTCSNANSRPHLPSCAFITQVSSVGLNSINSTYSTELCGRYHHGKWDFIREFWITRGAVTAKYPFSGVCRHIFNTWPQQNSRSKPSVAKTVRTSISSCCHSMLHDFHFISTTLEQSEYRSSNYHPLPRFVNYWFMFSPGQFMALGVS